MTDTTPAVDLETAEAEVDLPDIGDRERYDALMRTMRNRVTVRKFLADYKVPDEHFELILEAARHAPSGANAQPWQYVVVRDPSVKKQIADYFVAEQRFRAKAKMKFPTPDYRGLATAPGFVVVCSECVGRMRFRCSETISNSTACTTKMPSASFCSRWRPRQCQHIWRPQHLVTMSGG